MTPTALPCPADGAALLSMGDGLVECPRCGRVHDAAEVGGCV